MFRFPLTLSSTARQAMDRLAADLVRVLGDRFVALVAYDPTSTVAFATHITADDLLGLAPLVDRWHREGLDTPLVLTPGEFKRSLDAFPVEYDTILERHIVIAGSSPFDDARPSDADLRRACEVEAKAFLIHLRQGWLQAAGHHDAEHAMLAQSAVPLRALLSNVARLHGVTFAEDDVLIAFCERQIGLSSGVLRTVLALDGHADGAHSGSDAPGFMNDYLRAAETLWAFVDRWRS
jgi:hypothetical protein